MVFSPVPVLCCESRWLITLGVGRGAYGLGGVIFGGEGDFGTLCTKESQHFIFYPLSIIRF